MTRRWLMDEWRDTFVAELCLRGVPGHQIGEALAEVDAHCTDAGQAPGHAFGDPAGYALARARGAGLDNRKRVSPPLAALQAGAVTASVGGLLSGVDAVAHHAPGTVTAGQLIPVVLAPLLTAVTVAVMQRPGRRSRRALLAAAFPACLTAVAVPQFLWPQVILHAPGPALLVTGLLLLTIVLWPMAAVRRLADPVIDPRTGSAAFRIPPWATTLTRFALPAVLLAAVLLVLLMPTPGR